jgi:hypothetical protein
MIRQLAAMMLGSVQAPFPTLAVDAESRCGFRQRHCHHLLLLARHLCSLHVHQTRRDRGQRLIHVIVFFSVGLVDTVAVAPSLDGTLECMVGNEVGLAQGLLGDWALAMFMNIRHNGISLKVVPALGHHGVGHHGLCHGADVARWDLDGCLIVDEVRWCKRRHDTAWLGVKGGVELGLCESLSVSVFAAIAAGRCQPWPRRDYDLVQVSGDRLLR